MLWDVLVPAPGESRPSYLGVHMPGVYPEHRLVLEHRADTQQASSSVNATRSRSSAVSMVPAAPGRSERGRAGSVLRAVCG